jgi:hypothetical protein
MLSDVTISFANHAVTLPGVYILVGIPAIVALWGISVAIASARRTQRKMNDAGEVLVVQLERMGDALERLVKQNAAREAAFGQQAALARERNASGWAMPERPAQSAVSPTSELSGAQAADRSSRTEGLGRAAVAATSSARGTTAPGARAAGAQADSETPAPADRAADGHPGERRRAISLSMFGR